MTENSELPVSYGENKIIIMVRDPQCIFAYWDIAIEKINELKEKLKDSWQTSKFILRVYDITDVKTENAHKYSDIAIAVANSWYINVDAPDRTYCVEIGVLAENGEFLVIARSNAVHTPSNRVSDETDEEWISLFEQEKLSRFFGSHTSSFKEQDIGGISSYSK